MSDVEIHPIMLIPLVIGLVGMLVLAAFSVCWIIDTYTRIKKIAHKLGVEKDGEWIDEKENES